MRFLILFLLFWIALFLFWSLVVWGQTGNPTKMSQWISDAYAKKEQSAQNIKGRKIVIAAGSNALFGVDSQILSSALGLPVINDAVNAGIELPCILYMAKHVIRKGDIVIMPLEHSMYAYSGKPGVQMIDFLLSREPDCFWTLLPSEQFYLLWHTTLDRITKGYKSEGGEAISKGLYGAHNIDHNGDQIHTEISYRSEQMYRDILQRYITASPYTYGKEFSRSAPGWDYLEEFVEWCRERDAKVIFMPATLMPDKSYFDDPKERWFFENIAQEVKNRGWNYVGEPYDYMYDKSLYFNSDSHLIDRGRILRTEQMIKDLRKALPYLYDL